MPIGRQIINAPAMQSKLYPGRSARPGDAVFDQAFGQGTGNFSRADTYTDKLRGNQPRTAHFEDNAHNVTTSDALRGGIGRQHHVDTSGNNMSALIGAATQHQREMNIRDSMDVTPKVRHNTSQLSRGGIHNTSGQSLIGSSGEYHTGARPILQH